LVSKNVIKKLKGILKIIPILLIIIIIANSAKSQVTFFQNYNKKDGLQPQFIYSATQDSFGYMYFGTSKGLYRYDGHKFINIKSSLDNVANNIGTNLIHVTLDESNNVWCASYNSLQLYQPLSNTFYTPASLRQFFKTTSTKTIRHLFYHKQQMFFTLTTNEVYVYNYKDSIVKQINKHIKEDSYLNGCIAIGNKIALLYQTEIVVLNNKYGELYRIKIPHGYLWYNNFKNKICLFNNIQEAYIYDIDANKLNLVYANKKENLRTEIRAIAMTDTSIILAGNGLINYSLKTKQIRYNPQSKQDPHNLHARKIVNIFKDKEGNHWLCGHDGLSMLPWQNNYVSVVDIRPDDMHYIEPFEVAENKDNVYFAGNNNTGTAVLNKYNHKVSYIPNPPNNCIYSITNIGKNKIVGSTDNESYILSANNTWQKSKYKSIQGQSVAFSGPSYNIDSSTAIIAGATNNYYKANWLTNTFNFIKGIEGKDVDSITKNASVYPVLLDKKNNMWFISKVGIIKYDVKNNKVTNYGSEKNPTNGYLLHPQSIAEDKYQHKWICTRDMGLFELIDDTTKPTLIRHKVEKNYITTINYNAQNHTLIMSVDNGIFTYDIASKKSLGYITEDAGMPFNNEGYTNYIGENNILYKLYFGKIAIVNLNNYTTNPYVPKTIFSSIKFLDSEFAYQWLQNKNKVIELQPNQNLLVIQLSNLLYNNAVQNNYCVYLKGVDTAIRDLYAINEVSYANLAAGTYTLTAYGRNNDGLQGAPIYLYFKILKPVYLRWWFVLLSLAAIASIIALFYHNKIKSIKMQEKLKVEYNKQIANIEMRALRAQMNPHFIFNSLNSIQKYILKNQHFEASQYLTKFSKLIRLILDHSNENYVLLYNELELLSLYINMEQMRFDNKFTYNINTDEALNNAEIFIPSMLIQPYLENAIWHGLMHKDGTGHLELSIIKADNESIAITITDNGIGRAKAAELKSKRVLKNKSFGMQITEDRIKILNNANNINATATITDLYNNNGQAIGTKVQIILPIKTKL
jgi:ligand-binding sensor domain-containing protein